MYKKSSGKIFESINTQRDVGESVRNVAHITRRLGKLAMDFADIERMPRYKSGERENDAEHSFMLALVAPELAAALKLDLDGGLISQFAVVHDLVETKTGDIPTFHFDATKQTEKEAREHAALTQLVQELPPRTADLLQRYESQADPEARFVRYCDKLLPLAVAIEGQGARVMREDYEVTSLPQLRESHDLLQSRFEEMFSDEFPDLDETHRVLTELFEYVFIADE